MPASSEFKAVAVVVDLRLVVDDASTSSVAFVLMRLRGLQVDGATTRIGLMGIQLPLTWPSAVNEIPRAPRRPTTITSRVKLSARPSFSRLVTRKWCHCIPSLSREVHANRSFKRSPGSHGAAAHPAGITAGVSFWPSSTASSDPSSYSSSSSLDRKSVV